LKNGLNLAVLKRSNQTLMRKIYLLLVLLMAFTAFTQAAVHVIGVGSGGNFFNPTTISDVIVGDSIEFVWVSGSHTTTSASIPSGAAAWDVPMNSGSTIFYYPVTVRGTYNYVCSFHSSGGSGMVGLFIADTAQTNTGVSALSNRKNSLSILSNPVIGKQLHINLSLVQAGVADISVYDVLGKKVETVAAENFSAGDNERTFNLNGSYHNGFYFVMVKQGDMVITRKVVIQ